MLLDLAKRERGSQILPQVYHKTWISEVYVRRHGFLLFVLPDYLESNLPVILVLVERSICFGENLWKWGCDLGQLVVACIYTQSIFSTPSKVACGRVVF